MRERGRRLRGEGDEPDPPVRVRVRDGAGRRIDEGAERLAERVEGFGVAVAVGRC